MDEAEKTGEDRAKEVLVTIDFELFKNFALDLFKLKKKKLVDFEFLPEVFTFKSETVVSEAMKERHKIDDETFHRLIETFSNIVRTLITDREQQFLKMFADKETIMKAKKMLSLVNEHPALSNVKDRFLIVTYCKTKFLKDLDWEINIKKIQKKAGFESQSPIFPFCIMKLFLQPSYSRRIEGESTDTVTMELSLSDVTELIETFSQIRDNMIIESEKLSKMGTE